jgi:hypothetical protein
MPSTNRRTFIIHAAAAGTALAASHTAFAQGAPLAETDPQAVALGYKADTTKADTKKYPKHDNAQKCSNCQLFQGKAADAAGGCALFAGKAVAGNGWCSAWAKKA